MFKKSPERSLKQILKELNDELLCTYSLGKNDLEGYPLVNGVAIDYTFWNIIVTSENTLTLIDKKWRSKEPLPVDLILFRNLFNIFEKISPFFKNKNKKSFIIDMIQDIYPQYSENRLTENLQFERQFQSFVSGNEQNFTLDSLVQYSVNEQLYQNQEISAQVTNLNKTLAVKDQEILKIHDQIYVLKEENISLKNSISYRLFSKFHKVIIEPLFPHNSKRRRGYDLGLKGGRIFVDKGFKKTYTEFKNYMQMKRSLKKLIENNQNKNLKFQNINPDIN